jgi:hypothetical protein
LFAWLVIAVLYVGAAAWLAGWMLEPINRVAGHLQATTQYLLTDFLGLMVMLQAALALMGRAIAVRPGDDRSPYWILLSVALLLMFILWAASVSVVSRAGIIRPTRRLAVMLLLVPGALAVIVGWPLIVVTLAGLLGALDGTFLIRGRNSTAAALLGLACLALIVAPAFLRALSFWSLAGSPGAEMLLELQRAAAANRPGSPTRATSQAPSP